ncbi:uncharacterized protein BP01DRAFT_172244 [Aspergillus saccharolyticus JOP 1030-1]|uniref:Uncharacterized protein n=1 Tax=Aspergillus saccharolyticus JOP 1030-1 TaxID=1450539 RepID=A0A318Z4C1_9EURO|nr:hypothetical protein BP01DRAFT_172244 [Aspergillus saccharolyticus JOP 1030-1]PYH41274.1 hypothetical protein BP01DRAFT_172244 [Aspergillus saccharolyticus JOP 1030-1]
MSQVTPIEPTYLDSPAEWIKIIAEIVYPPKEPCNWSVQLSTKTAPDHGLCDMITVANSRRVVLIIATGQDLFVPPLEEDNLVQNRRFQCMQKEWREHYQANVPIFGGWLVAGYMRFMRSVDHICPHHGYFQSSRDDDSMAWKRLKGELAACGHRELPITLGDPQHRDGDYRLWVDLDKARFAEILLGVRRFGGGQRCRRLVDRLYSKLGLRRAEWEGEGLTVKRAGSE